MAFSPALSSAGSPPLAALAPTRWALRELDQRLLTMIQLFGLSPAQSRVLRLVVFGLSNKEIAARCHCSEVNVEGHMTALLRRTGSDGRGMLVARFWLERDS